MTQQIGWRPTMGANVTAEGTRFAVWAPNARRVEVVIEGGDAHALSRREDDVHEGTVPGIGAGARYRFRLDGGEAYPDPYSRFQPEGPHGPSEVVDPGAFAWSGAGWPGLGPDGLVIYECHVGTMTPEGTFQALIGQLPELKRLGVTALELMPVAECPGRRNWGYDGVDLFAPSRNYGRPEDLKKLVDEAHRLGLGVLLDVVYNHLGPDGNYLRAFSDHYFTDRHQTPWGDALNYDGPGSRFVRDLAIDNACYWLAEFHLDGLRLDATHAIVDDSPTHLLAELNDRARAATPRRVVLVAEDERNDVRLVRPREEGGYGLDGVWADDFHHAVRVLLTGEREGYYGDYAGTPTEAARALRDGFVFQGQPKPRSGEPRGTEVTDEPARAFVFAIQNHDQVGNRAYGERLHHDVDAGRYAAASALLLLAPQTPLLFMGQEFAASASFMFFTDHEPDLGSNVTEGRRDEFKGFRAFADPLLRETIPDPQAEETFVRSRLNLRERQANADIYRLYRDLLALRRHDPVLTAQDRQAMAVEVVGAQTLVVHRWHGDEHRLLIANFGPSLGVAPADPALGGMPQ
ncbi:MAG: malto-oligosyltrehalose trehalohydrolase, partial [Chloroflexota bacterium]|nr:malto-oligosyltrehalose trehalohydrolase [Chloroflexota bacterium]